MATSTTACGDGGGAVMTTQPSSMAGSTSTGSMGGSGSMNMASNGGDMNVGGAEMGMDGMNSAGMSPGDDIQVQPVYGVAIQPEEGMGGGSGSVTGDGRPTRPGVGGAGVEDPPSAVALYGVAPIDPIDDGTGGASSADPTSMGGDGADEGVGGAGFDPGGGAVQPLYGVATLPEEE